MPGARAPSSTGLLFQAEMENPVVDGEAHREDELRIRFGGKEKGLPGRMAIGNAL